MRIINVKRKYSLKVMFDGEREEFKHIPFTTQEVTVEKGGKKYVKKMHNPYLINFLKDRYEIYENSLAKGHTNQEYYNAVKEWYLFKGYVFTKGDKSHKGGDPSTIVAIRNYQQDYYDANPDSEWRTPERVKKSHHGTGAFSKQKEAEQKKAWNANARLQAKLAKHPMSDK